MISGGFVINTELEAVIMQRGRDVIHPNVSYILCRTHWIKRDEATEEGNLSKSALLWAFFCTWIIGKTFDLTVNLPCLLC